MAEQNVAKIFCKASKAHRQKGSAIEANMAESEQNSFAYENSQQGTISTGLKITA